MPDRPPALVVDQAAPEPTPGPDEPNIPPPMNPPDVIPPVPPQQEPPPEIIPNTPPVELPPTDRPQPVRVPPQGRASAALNNSQLHGLN